MQTAGTAILPKPIRRRTRKVSAKPLPTQAPAYLREVHADIDGLLQQSPEFRAVLSAWIRANISSAKRTCPATSYGLKHVFSADCHVYITNDAFKAGLLLEGYLPINPNELNWRYRLKVKENRDRWPSEESITWRWPEDREAANG